MPYCTIEDKVRVQTFNHPETPGELNYAITLLLIDYTERKGLKYSTINDVVGAAEGAKAEYQRRVVAPYEDKKIAENGDVYPRELTGVSKNG